jgi:hypothetical protein
LFKSVWGLQQTFHLGNQTEDPLLYLFAKCDLLGGYSRVALCSVHKHSRQVVTHALVAGDLKAGATKRKAAAADGGAPKRAKEVRANWDVVCAAFMNALSEAQQSNCAPGILSATLQGASLPATPPHPPAVRDEATKQYAEALFKALSASREAVAMAQLCQRVPRPKGAEKIGKVVSKYSTWFVRDNSVKGKDMVALTQPAGK